MDIDSFHMVASEPLRQAHTSRHRLAAWQAVVRQAEQAQATDHLDTDYVACAPGCGTCCAINVNILEPEALAITDYVEKYFLPADKTALRSRLETLHRETRWLDDEERMMIRKACAFLDEQQNCSVHPARPLLCRSLTSTDPVSCREAIGMLALGEPPRVICNLRHKKLYEDAYLGLADALKSFQLDAASYRLTGKLFTILQN